MPNLIFTLEQDVFWYGQGGRPYIVDDSMSIDELEKYQLQGAAIMDQSHRINVWRNLLQRASTLQSEWLWWQNETYLSHSLPDNPENWLKRRPFMIKLRHVILRNGSEDEGSLAIEVS